MVLTGENRFTRNTPVPVPLFTPQIPNQPAHVHQTHYEYELQLVQYMFVLSQYQQRIAWPVGCAKYADRKYF
jgi:hypothetical protein